MAQVKEAEHPVEVAVVGGGVVGLALVLGLLHRGVKVKVYEKTSSFRPIGAGIGFTPNAMRALGKLHPQALEAQQRVATANGDPDNPNDWIVYLDAYHHETEEDEEVPIFKLYCGRRGFEGCVRAAYMDQLLKIIPEGTIEFSKSIEDIVDRGDDQKILLKFRDGTTAEADAVIGCDGIKSHVRRLIVGEDHASAEPSYNHQYALRGLVPMDKAIEALGEYKGLNRHMHLGPGSYVATVPVALGKFVNLVAFIQDPEEWPDLDRLTAPADREQVRAAFKDFGRPVRNLIDWVVDSSPQLDKWGIFDCVDKPCPTFSKSRVCIAGDAAHAAAPHHGAGAGMGIEDNLVLAELLAEVSSNFTPGIGRSAAIRAAFEAYSHARMERTQWVSESSRVIGELLEWRYPETMDNWQKCEEELTWRSHRIWDYDHDVMIADAKKDYEQILSSTGNSDLSENEAPTTIVNEASIKETSVNEVKPVKNDVKTTELVTCVPLDTVEAN